MPKRLCLTNNSEGNCLNNPKQSINLVDLPTEIIIIILKYISYHELAINVRGVSKVFYNICNYLLNEEFLKLESLIEKDINNLNVSINLMLQNDVDNSQIKHTFLVRDEMELIQNEYRFTKAVIWRYVYGPYKLSNMFAGKVLDCFKYILSLSYKERSTQHLQLITEINKKFQNFFENEIEFNLSVNPVYTAAKVIDILDSMYDVLHGFSKNVEIEDYNLKEGTYNVINEYTVSGAWYCVLNSDLEFLESSVKTKWRAILHNIRRIAIFHSTYILKDIHKCRRMTILNDTHCKYNPLCFSGINHKSTTFFGCMNMTSYKRRYPTGIIDIEQIDNGELEHRMFGFERDENRHNLRNEEVEGEEDYEFDELRNGESITAKTSEEIIKLYQNITNISLNVNVKLRCPLDFCPMRVYLMHKNTIKEKTYNFDDNENFFVNLNLLCTSAMTSHLPYSWTFALLPEHIRASTTNDNNN